MDLFIALLPALIMIILVIVTRRVVLSLAVGSLLGAMIFTWQEAGAFAPLDTLRYLWDAFYGIMTDFQWYMPILGFVVLIGGLTSVIAVIGGIRAFADWSVQRVKSPVAAKLLTWVLGLLIFIDDYFNALVIGEVSKPITDRYKISRAKLAYVIDSTSAPVVILMPISTWGAYIIGILGSEFDSAGYTETSAFGGLLGAVPYQFYPLTAIAMVLLTILYGINMGPMKTFESKASNDQDISVMASDDKVDVDEDAAEKANHFALITPVIALVFFTILFMFAAAEFSLGAVLDQDITQPLFFAGVIAFVIALVFAFITKAKADMVVRAGLKGMGEMIKSAVVILVLAWIVSGAISDLEVGTMIGEYVEAWNMSAAVMPLIMFFIAGGVAFSTGTSWGAFALLLPIAVPVAMASDPAMMSAIIASVLGGAVFGDHASPVSDTTVLSSTGARSSVHAHFVSQLPYALSTAAFAGAGYGVYALSESLLLSYAIIIVLLVGFVYFRKGLNKQTD